MGPGDKPGPTVNDMSNDKKIKMLLDAGLEIILTNTSGGLSPFYRVSVTQYPEIQVYEQNLSTALNKLITRINDRLQYERTVILKKIETIQGKINE